MSATFVSDFHRISCWHHCRQRRNVESMPRSDDVRVRFAVFFFVRSRMFEKSGRHDCSVQFNGQKNRLAETSLLVVWTKWVKREKGKGKGTRKSKQESGILLDQVWFAAAIRKVPTSRDTISDSWNLGQARWRHPGWLELKGAFLILINLPHFKMDLEWY